MATTDQSYQLSDTQAETDRRRIRLDRVGIRSLTLPLTIADREQDSQPVTAEVDVGIELPEDQRGAHMSRFIEMTEDYREKRLSLDSVSEFLNDTCDRLETDTAYVDFRFDYFMEKQSPLSEKEGVMDFHCGLGGMVVEDRVDTWIVTEVPVTTLCPCSKTNSNDGAHNQRALVTSQVVLEDFVWLEELIELTERQGSSQLYSLLKREDEAYVTDEAYENPRFVEDVVRDLSAEITEDERMGAFQVECVSYESIHNHDAYAQVREGEIWRRSPYLSFQQ